MPQPAFTQAPSILLSLIGSEKTTTHAVGKSIIALFTPMLWLAGTLALSCTLYPLATQAQERHGHTRGAHIHGKATITLASIDNIIEMQLTSPAANLLGFEHAAVNAQELEKLNSVRATLQKPSQLFSFSGTSCQSKSISIDFSNLDQGDPLDSRGGAHHENRPDESHHEEHHDHHHGQQEHQSTSSHSEIFAKYQFKCKASVAGVNFTLIDVFTGIEEISVVWLTTLAQGSSKITSSARTLNLN